MEQNFIKIFHQFLAWEWYQDINAKTLFLHCLLKSNCQPEKWQGRTIEAGSFVTSLPILATELNISVQQVRTALIKLKSTGEITDKSTNGYRVISIVNWEEYQDNQQAEQQTDNRQITDEQQTDNRQIADEQQADNIYLKKKEFKEIKNIKKETTEKVFLGLIENYTCNLELRTTLLDFMQMRKVIKKPMTERALTLLFGKLEKLGNVNYQISVLEQSILNNWQDIYELKTKSVFEKKYEKIDIQEKSKQNCQDFLATWEAAE